MIGTDMVDISGAVASNNHAFNSCKEQGWEWSDTLQSMGAAGGGGGEVGLKPLFNIVVDRFKKF